MRLIKKEWWHNVGYESPEHLADKIDYEGGILEFLYYGFNAKETPFEKEWNVFDKAVRNLKKALQKAGVSS